ncbi:hypothetical protein BJV74DRAFT_833718, partial [Russula compacta]
MPLPLSSYLCPLPTGTVDSLRIGLGWMTIGSYRVGMYNLGTSKYSNPALRALLLPLLRALLVPRKVSMIVPIISPILPAAALASPLLLFSLCVRPSSLALAFACLPSPCFSCPYLAILCSPRPLTPTSPRLRPSHPRRRLLVLSHWSPLFFRPGLGP